MTLNYGFEKPKSENSMETYSEIQTANNQTTLVKEIVNSRVFKKNELNLLSMMYPIKPLWKFLEFKVQNTKHIRGKQRDKAIVGLESTNIKVAENNLFQKLFAFRSQNTY